jgi:HK97 gp10 family phage protein
MGDVEFSIIGLDSLLKKLEAVSYDVKRKGGRSALRKAAQVVQKAAQQGAEALDDPSTGRSISKNIAIRWNNRLFKRTGALGFRVGVSGGAESWKKGQVVVKDSGAKTPHWRLLEFGTSKMRAQPFMRKALESNINEATNTFVKAYEKAIDRAIKRAAKGK